MKRLTKAEGSWVMYDWANSVHSIIISTAIFPLWFGQVAEKGGLSTTQTTFWLGSANTAYALIVAAMAAVMGTLSDYRGFRRRLFILFWLFGVVSTATLVLVGAGAWSFALVLYVCTFIGFAGSNIFYDASLPDVTTPERMSMVSTKGFAYGYIGGSTIPFLIALGLIVMMAGPDLANGLPVLAVKITFGLTALWWFFFTLPYLKNVQQRNGMDPVPNPLADSFRRLAKTFREIRQHKKVFLFLLAYFFYIDGVGTIIKMATNFADSIGIGFAILLVILVGIQLLAFPFSLLYGRLAQRFGTRNMLFVGLGVYSIITALGTIMPLVPTAAVLPLFFVVAFLVSSSQGGIQALSRSYYASLLPNQNSVGEFFGFYNTMGKFAAILGPILMGSFPRLAVLLGIVNEKAAYSFGVGAIFLLFLAGTLFFIGSIRSKPSSG